jgi:hypothetical protein
MKSGNRNSLEPSGPDQACNGTALPSNILFIILFYFCEELFWLSTDTLHFKVAAYSNLEAWNRRHYCNCWLRNGISYATWASHFSFRSIRSRYGAIPIPYSMGTSDFIPVVRRLGLEFYFLSPICLHDLHKDVVVITFMCRYLCDLCIKFRMVHWLMPSIRKPRQSCYLIVQKNQNIAH